MSDWDGPEGRLWAANAPRYRRMLASFGEHALAAARLTDGERVLDVGCGNGDLSVGAAKAVGPTGRVVGVDLSPSMLDVARRETEAAGLTNAEFAHADAATWTSDHPFDVLVSRFGVMFFDDPVGAFCHLRTLLRPDGRVSFVCWQSLAANEWILVPGMALAEVVPLTTGADPSAPGPFAFGSDGHVRRVLENSGFVGIDLAEVHGPMWLGADLDDVVDYLRLSSLLQVLLGGVSADVRADALQRVRDALAPFAGEDGVVLDGAAWLVTARTPSRA